jgi:geranylgeranyl diphosphate synthase, type I
MSLTILSAYRSNIIDALSEALRADTPLCSILRYHAGLTDQDDSPADATGKLLRPSLVMFVAEQLSAPLERAMSAAIGLELIHNFSLIHDDIQDGDRTRRGRPTVWARWGVNEAINAGDLMQALAVRSALRAGPAVAERLLQATLEMIEGQSLDLSFEARRVPLDDYLQMIDRKTGALLTAAFELAGIVAAAEAGTLSHLAQLGHAVGRAFQIQDDLLGIWGQSNVIGKPRGSDIRQRKQSYPAILAFERASGDDLAMLTAVYDRDIPSDAEVTQVMTLMTKLGIQEAGRTEVQRHLDAATQALDALPFTSAGRHDLMELIDYLARRNK